MTAGTIGGGLAAPATDRSFDRQVLAAFIRGIRRGTPLWQGYDDGQGVSRGIVSSALGDGEHWGGRSKLNAAMTRLRKEGYLHYELRDTDIYWWITPKGADSRNWPK